MSRNFISLLESGDRSPSDRTIDDVCRKYNVNRQWLETGIGEMHNPINSNIQVSNMLKNIIRPDGSEHWQEARKIIIESFAEMSPEFWEQAAKLVDEIAKKAQKKREVF